MIVKIKTDNLRPGHFIHDFNCGWNGGNIFIDQTLIRDWRLIDIIRSWGITEVYIDTERSQSLGPKDKVHSPAAPARPAPGPEISGSENKHPPPLVPVSVELKQASQLKNDALNVVQYNLNQVAEGKAPDVALSYELARKMQESISRNRDALLLLTRIRKKDEYTLYHSISVSSLVLDMCNFKRIPHEQSLDLAVGALFHDIGKARIPRNILNKPNRLNSIEYHEMKKHVEYSVDLLRSTKQLPMECFDIALHHHERYDGGGYPHGLKGGQISFGAQLTAICDVFDAITSTRCYREGVGTVPGLKKIYELSGKHFSKKLAHEFIRCIGVYPVGSCVRLADGKIGIVVGASENMLKPVVKLFFDEKLGQKIRPLKVDLSETENTIVSYEELGRHGITSANMIIGMVA